MVKFKPKLTRFQVDNTANIQQFRNQSNLNGC